MIKNVPQETFSKEQHRKAKTCVVTAKGDDFQVWNPQIDTLHQIIKGMCDCIGFKRHGKCYHHLALSLWHKRNEGLTYDQAIEELFGKL